MIGWGTSDIASFARSTENPTLVLARRLWGKAWILMAVAVLNSILGVSIASTNAATRVFYAMGRIGILPRVLATIHPRYKTPSNAIWLQSFLTLLIGLGLGSWIGPESEYLFLGILMTLALVFVYGFGNFGVWLFYRRECPAEFNLILHLVFPLVSTVALIWVGYDSVVPLPPAPLRYAGPVVGAWLIARATLAKSLPGLAPKEAQDPFPSSNAK